MGRDTGTQQNTDTQKQAMAIEQDQVNRANKSTDDYNSSLKTLAGGGKIASNPWTDPTYLQNQNLITSAASSGVNSAAKEQLNTEAQRTGSNTASRTATIADLARQKMRTQTDYQAGQSADNYNKYLDWERFILGAKLAPTSANTALFGTAAGQVNSANTNLANIGIADQSAEMGMWGNIIGGVSSGLGSAFTGKA